MQEEDKFGDEKKWKDPKIIFTTDDLIQCGIEVNIQFDGIGLLKVTHVHELPTDTEQLQLFSSEYPRIFILIVHFFIATTRTATFNE